jgi:hypothetical protein
MRRIAKMIDSMNETVVTYAQASDAGPRRRKGRKIHVSTFHRWATVGCRGVVLETIQIGGTRCTSLEALQRFFERLTDQKQSVPHNAVGAGRTRSQARRLRDSEAAGRELDRLGG